MSDDLIELARRAVASPHWRWMPGMRDLGGNVYLGRRANAPEGVHQWCAFDRGGWEWHEDEFGLPDLSDPATLGCLLALVREATGELVFAGFEFRKSCWHVMIPCGRDPMASGTTEAAALVAALEALEAAPEVER